MPERRTVIAFEIPRDAFGPPALAALSGVRSLAPPALLARAIRRGETPSLETTPFAKLGPAANALLFLMVGEMLADKTPFIPARTSPGPALGRALSGALVGATLSASAGHGSVAGALTGGASALAGLLAADRARGWVTGSANIPDPLWGALEDALVLFAGSRLTTKRP